MRPAAFIGALVGAALGALIWAGVATWTGLEIGWVAWGIGGAVGFGAAMFGGIGSTTGAVCAVLALVSIFAGKWIAVDAIAEREIRKLATTVASMDVYQDTQRDADDFAVLTSEAEYAEFMIVHGYTNAGFADEVQPLEMAAFRQIVVPQLREFQRMGLSYPKWREHVADEAVGMWDATVSNTDLVKDNLSAFDFLFGLLGLITAYQVGARGMGGGAGVGGSASSESLRAAGMHGSTYGDTAEGYATYGAQAAGTPNPGNEPPNPYAHPAPAAQPSPGQPATPFQPRTIGRLEEQPQQAGSRNP